MVLQRKLPYDPVLHDQSQQVENHHDQENNSSEPMVSCSSYQPENHLSAYISTNSTGYYPLLPPYPRPEALFLTSTHTAPDPYNSVYGDYTPSSTTQSPPSPYDYQPLLPPIKLASHPASPFDSALQVQKASENREFYPFSPADDGLQALESSNNSASYPFEANQPSCEVSSTARQIKKSDRTLKREAKLAAVNGIVIASKLAAGKAPFNYNGGNTHNKDPNLIRTLPCPICDAKFHRVDHVKSHFVACVGFNGNPTGARWNDRILGSEVRFLPGSSRFAEKSR
ncbi:hypothetical protein MMC28_006918 [Mycoblastus sanguinarius]|nr:hypothetical protein [Mycoblastus sanguinarius]